MDLDLHPGERVALVGANGSGKTTLARVLLGLLSPSGGTVRVGGRDPGRASRSDLAALVGLVFQNPDHQIFAKRVWDEVAFGPRTCGLAESELERRVREELVRFDLDGQEDRLPAALSGGERKRVAFASAAVLQPRVLLLDEPTKGMDAGRKRALAAWGRDLAAEGRTVVFITHDLEFALEATERTAVLQEGVVVRDGPTVEVLADPALEEAGLALPPLARLAASLRASGREEASLAYLRRVLEGAS